MTTGMQNVERRAKAEAKRVADIAEKRAKNSAKSHRSGGGASGSNSVCGSQAKLQ